MLLLLNKVLPLFVLPFGLSLILLTWGVVRRRRGLSAVGLAILLISSQPVVGNYLIRWTEQWAERRVASAMPVVDAIVVLSAGRVRAPGPEKMTEWADANRYFGGLELFRAGRSSLLVFTGSWVAWDPDAPLEGEVLAGFARSSGVPASQIAVTGRVGNTADEATEVVRLLRSRGVERPHVLLVTSAFHMPRARQQFESVGIQVEPFPVDFSISEGAHATVLDFLPGLGALGKTQTALRELYGRAYYRVTSR